MSDPKVTGLHTHRFADNPEEARFAKAFERFDERNLDYLLQPAEKHGSGAYYVEPATDRERVVGSARRSGKGSCGTSDT